MAVNDRLVVCHWVCNRPAHHPSSWQLRLRRVQFGEPPRVCRGLFGLSQAAMGSCSTIA